MSTRIAPGKRTPKGRARAAAPLVALALSGALLAGPPGVAGAQTAAPPGPSSRPRVVFYGDSQLHESRDRIQALVDQRFRGSWDVEMRSFPGSSICGWFDDMRADHANVVVLLFSGVWIGSSCEDPLNPPHRTWPQSYFQDLATAIQIWQAKHTTVVVLHWPEACCGPAAPELIWSGYQQVAARYGVTTLDPALALFDPFHDTWPASMPCLRTNEPGCDPASGMVAVRDAVFRPGFPGGGHLCPVQEILTPCPVYASGIERYAKAIAREVGDVMERVVPVAAAPRAVVR